jgi:hypothetical protein
MDYKGKSFTVAAKGGRNFEYQVDGDPKPTEIDCGSLEEAALIVMRVIDGRLDPSKPPEKPAPEVKPLAPVGTKPEDKPHS